MAVALEGGLGNFERFGRRVPEAGKAAAIFANLGKRIELLLGRLDLFARRIVDIFVGCARGDLVADVNEAAALMRLEDRPAVIGDMSKARHRCRKLAQIGFAAELIKRAFRGEVRLEHNRIGQETAIDVALDDFVDACVHRIVEVFRQQEGVDALDRLVVEQNRTKKKLLGLEIVRQGGVRRIGSAIRRRHAIVRHSCLVLC